MIHQLHTSPLVSSVEHAREPQPAKRFGRLRGETNLFTSRVPVPNGIDPRHEDVPALAFEYPHRCVAVKHPGDYYHSNAIACRARYTAKGWTIVPYRGDSEGTP